jgi:hypothetical protein
MKTYAPKGLHGADLRGILDDLHASPLEVSKYLHVTERSVWRWLSDGSAPFAVLACLWHETPRGRESAACDVGNELVIQRTLAKSSGAAHAAMSARMARLVRISDTGAANDPLASGPFSDPPALARLSHLETPPALSAYGFLLAL